MSEMQIAVVAGTVGYICGVVVTCAHFYLMEDRDGE